MADSLGDVIINLRSKDINMKAGLDGVREELDHLGSKIFSFEGALHIAFGAAASRAIFHELHHTLKELGEGFVEAQEHGADFHESLNEGINKVMGLKTAYEQAAEASKKLTESNEKVKKAVDDIDKITGENKQDEKYPNLKESQQESAKKDAADLNSDIDDASKQVTEAIKNKKQHEKEYQDRLRALNPLTASIMEKDPDQQAKRAAQAKEDDTAIDAARAHQKEREALKARKDDELGHADAKAGAKKFEAKAKSMWDNLAGTFKEAWKPVNEAIEKTGKAMHKEGVKGVKHDAEKSLEYKMKELDRFIESEMQKQRKQEEQEKHDDESAKHIRDASDPTAKLKDEFTEIARLIGIGKLTQEEADKSRKKDVKEFNKENQRDNKVEFRSADQAANDMLKKSLEEASLQKETNVLLQQISDKIGKPQPGAMV